MWIRSGPRSRSRAAISAEWSTMRVAFAPKVIQIRDVPDEVHEALTDAAEPSPTAPPSSSAPAARSACTATRPPTCCSTSPASSPPPEPRPSPPQPALAPPATSPDLYRGQRGVPNRPARGEPSRQEPGFRHRSGGDLSHPNSECLRSRFCSLCCPEIVVLRRGRRAQSHPLPPASRR